MHPTGTSEMSLISTPSLQAAEWVYRHFEQAPAIAEFVVLVYPNANNASQAGYFVLTVKPAGQGCYWLNQFELPITEAGQTTGPTILSTQSCAS